MIQHLWVWRAEQCYFDFEIQAAVSGPQAPAALAGEEKVWPWPFSGVFLGLTSRQWNKPKRSDGRRLASHPAFLS